MRVIFYDPNGKEVGVATLDQDGEVVGDSQEMTQWLWHHFVPDKNLQPLKPDDGVKFLKALPNAFRGQFTAKFEKD